MAAVALVLVDSFCRKANLPVGTFDSTKRVVRGLGGNSWDFVDTEGHKMHLQAGEECGWIFTNCHTHERRRYLGYPRNAISLGSVRCFMPVDNY